jgi:hypothetical protein
MNKHDIYAAEVQRLAKLEFAKQLKRDAEMDWFTIYIVFTVLLALSTLVGFLS